jgi:hypothetical protein
MYWIQWNVLCQRRPGPYKPEPGDIHILSKQGEAFIQPKINARDISDDLVAEWMMSRESIQTWTTKLGLVNSTDHSLVISSEEMEASERFSQFAEAWKTPAKRGRSVSLLPDRILPGPDVDFTFVKNIPEDPSQLISQIGWDPAKEGRIIHALVNIEAALEVYNNANQATFEIVNNELVAGKSTSEILLAKIDNIKSRIGASIKEEGPILSPTLWGAIYELGGRVSGESGRPKDGLVFTEEEMEKLQDLSDIYYYDHLKPFIEDSLKEYITTSASDANTELLLDGAERVDEDLEHLDMRIKTLEATSVGRQNRPHGIQTRMDKYGSAHAPQAGPPSFDIESPMPQEDRDALGEKVQ